MCACVRACVRAYVCVCVSGYEISPLQAVLLTLCVCVRVGLSLHIVVVIAAYINLSDILLPYLLVYDNKYVYN